ncbi:HSP20-like chaperone [Amylocarpus encephaloides]|uniref:HSP20-like chaperone n=1 Tax=Amylocarpus encephaloides TaxID=45428 RepID=A0A9P7YKH9_9HELO|nr:HSP20-like chaperone [Amylocarpus encephaloides]
MSYRAITRSPIIKTIAHQPTRNMSLFSHRFPYSSPEPSFHPLFRLLNDFDTFANPNSGSSFSQLNRFQPKFDVKEDASKYELHGELPGIAQKDVEIEFTDANTLTIRGRTVKTYEQGRRPVGAVEGAEMSGAITEGEKPASPKAHQASVEDESAVGNSREVVHKGADRDQHEEENTEKMWVSERSVGEFSRSFSFPGKIDQDAVRASMKDGILSILVPKAKVGAARKIQID